MARNQKVRPVLIEAGMVLSVGLAFGLLANYLSPRGLDLRRNYFPPEPTKTVPTATTESTVGKVPATVRTNQQVASAAARLRQAGLQPIDTGQAEQFFNDPRRQQGLVVFIDARDEEHYRDGHIPGAVELDYYHIDKYLSAVLPVCLPAQVVVVYCHGGDCEDSEYAVRTLKETGVPAEKLFVYTGGITEWKARKLPVEIGPQDSGHLQP